MNYEMPKKYWEERDPKTKKVEHDKLLGMIEEYISKHNVMALATSHDDIVRNTPVEYIYWKGAFCKLQTQPRSCRRSRFRIDGVPL